MDLSFGSAKALAASIRARQIGCRELLEHFIGRNERHGARINAIVVPDFERARRRADSADGALARGEIWGPLHGVPITVKESFNVAGLPTTRGLPDLRNARAPTNMLAVDRLLDAGAVIFGKTNVPLLLADWQSFNDVYGTTNNPWDLTRTPGGSSGGGAAAVAAGLSALDTGSDSAGSLRIPAHYCGIYAHRPTYGICPQRGHELGGKVAPRDLSTLGPLARSAEDLALLLGIMSGPEEGDASGWRLELPKPRHRELRDYRVAVILDDAQSPVDASIQDRIQRLASFLSQQGATVRDARPELDSAEAVEVFIRLVRASASAGLPQPVFDSALEYAQAHPGDDGYRAQTARADTMLHREWHAANEARHRMRAKWADFFGKWDVLLCPPASSVAVPHDQATKRWEQKIAVNGKALLSTAQMFWVGFSAMVFLPTTIAPIGLSPEGLPIGVQIIAPQFEDLTAIHFAGLLERHYARFVPPPGFA